MSKIPAPTFKESLLKDKLLNFFPNLNIIPSNPLSLISMLEPAPIIWYFIIPILFKISVIILTRTVYIGIY